MTQWLVFYDDREDGERVFDSRCDTLEEARERISDLSDEGYDAWLEREE